MFHFTEIRLKSYKQIIAFIATMTVNRNSAGMNFLIVSHEALLSVLSEAANVALALFIR